ncbi:MAG: TonB-dependent receptor, partial [Gammaproteobacteria bacterium]|nr:TonB-dependent receptor [Gammaproteobacteria bacterium]
ILNDNWTIYGSYAYNRAELTEDAPNLIGLRDGSRVDAFDGDRLPGTPESQGTVNINYHRPVADNLMMDIDYGFTSTSDVYTKTGLRGSGESLSGFTVHHLSAGISDETWSVRLFADNLFDKYAVTGVRNDKDYIDKRADGDGIGSNQFTLRRYYQNVIRPRTIGIDFRYRFDL